MKEQKNIIIYFRCSFNVKHRNNTEIVNFRLAINIYYVDGEIDTRITNLMSCVKHFLVLTQIGHGLFVYDDFIMMFSLILLIKDKN